MTGIDPAFGHWLAGFIDGEGCFRIAHDRRSGWACPRFALTVRDDELPILEEIVARTAIGTIQRKPIKTVADQATWAAEAKRDTRALVALLDAFPLRAKKRRDYEIWKLAVRIQAAPGRSSGFAAQRTQWRLLQLKRQLENVRAYPDDDTLALEPFELDDDQLELGL